MTDYSSRIDDQTWAFIRKTEACYPPDSTGFTIADHRRVYDRMAASFHVGRPDSTIVQDIPFAGVQCRLYTPSGVSPGTTVMYFHGGGFVLGGLDSHDDVCAEICKRTGYRVVSVDYGLAPDVTFPGCFNDAWAAFSAISDAFDGDLILCGDSAGGNLAVTVALRARDEGGPSISGQLLIYPVVETDFETESYRACAEGFGLSREVMMWFWEQYVGKDRFCDLDAYAAPMRAATLQRLPPTHVITAEYDVLRSECESLAAALIDAGVPTTVRQYDGMLHGFVHFNGVFTDGDRAVDDLAEVIRNLGT